MSGVLTDFISYAVQGLLDGLSEVLVIAQRHQIESCWRNYVYDKLDANGFSRNVHKRYAKLLTSIDVFGAYTRDALETATAEVAAAYARIAKGTILRDVRALVALGLLGIDDQGKYVANTRAIIERLPQSRTFADEPVAK